MFSIDVSIYMTIQRGQKVKKLLKNINIFYKAAVGNTDGGFHPNNDLIFVFQLLVFIIG